MNNIVVSSVLIMSGLFAVSVDAAPRDSGGSAKAVSKLQSMVRDISSERDALRSERDTLKIQLDTDTKKLTDDINKLKQEKAGAELVGSRLNSELSVLKQNNESLTSRLEKTNAKLLEVIEKYKVLNQEKNTLNAKHDALEDDQRQTKTELQSCEGKNLKLFEATRSLLKNYEDKDVLETFLHNEPFLQLKSVEMEAIVQEYEDKLRSGKYQQDKKPAN
jgi:chromosome segregation ATPase